jgi:hypothetical protein
VPDVQPQRLHRKNAPACVRWNCAMSLDECGAVVNRYAGTCA